MLKLKYLFGNDDLAEMLLKNWEYDEKSLSFFRASANIVYQFENGGKKCFLRFSPSSEKDISEIKGEINFIDYLLENNFAVNENIPSKDGSKIITKDTPWGKYNACVFKEVNGRRIDRIEINDEIIYRMGKTLGQLHKLSAKYNEGRKKNYFDMLDSAEKCNNECGDKYQNAVNVEIGFLRKEFGKISKSKTNYGLDTWRF